MIESRIPSKVGDGRGFRNLLKSKAKVREPSIKFDGLNGIAFLWQLAHEL
jgi:hypothetical protein